MKVPIDAVKKMKATFSGPRELFRYAKVCGLRLTYAEAKAFWSGSFRGASLVAVEAFWLCMDYEVRLVRVGNQ
jgi:hypothetical protein